jgi:hypothetical protein
MKVRQTANFWRRSGSDRDREALLGGFAAAFRRFSVPTQALTG